MKLRKLQSRQRLIIRLALAMIVVLCAGAWISSMAIERELKGRIDEQLRAEATGMGGVIEMLDTNVLEVLSDQLAVGERDWALVVLDGDGVQAFMPAGSTEDPRPLPDVVDTPISELRGRAGEPFTIGDVDGGSKSYRAITVALDDGRVALFARTFEPVNAVLRIVHKTFIVGVLLGLLALGALVWIISRHALKPLERVVDTAHLIGAGNLNTRVEMQSTAPDVERLAEALNTMLDRLQTAFDNKERSEARLRQFASDASHELRTPLAAILGYAELYDQNMARSPEQVDTAMRRIVAEATRMRSLVEDLLLLARLDEGRQLARDAVDLDALVGESVTAMQAIDGDHTIVLTLSTTPVEVVGDELALREVLDNLLTNVVTHTPPGTTATVTVACDRRSVDGVETGGAAVTVTDDGPGMTPEQAAKVFDRFYRAEPSRSRPGGSGLGLAIVDELVRAHGGHIELQTAPGEGTTFTIWVPSPVSADDAVDSLVVDNRP